MPDRMNIICPRCFASMKVEIDDENPRPAGDVAMRLDQIDESVRELKSDFEAMAKELRFMRTEFAGVEQMRKRVMKLEKKLNDMREVL